MNDFEPQAESPENTARNSLKEIIRSSKYERYTDSKVPLIEEFLDQQITDSDEFIEVKALYDWPESVDRFAFKHLQREYRDNKDFLYHLRVPPSEGDDPDHKRRYLNNFNVWLRTKPSNVLNPEDIQEGAYSFQPALHRGYVLAPDLLENLQIFFSSARSRLDADELTKFLALPENKEIVAGAHMAYQILGRLFKHADMYIQMKNMFNDDSNAQPIYDIHKALTA